MSISLMNFVWGANIKPQKKFVLLALCDYADNAGGSVFPSIRTLAVKISLSERQTQRVVHGLIADKWITVVKNENGGTKGQTRHYAINISKLGTGVKMSPVRSDKGYKKRMSPETSTGDPYVTQNIKEPLNNPYIEALRGVGLTVDVQKRWFNNAKFYDEGRVIGFETEFKRSWVEKEYSTHLYRAFGFYPTLKVISKDI